MNNLSLRTSFMATAALLLLLVVVANLWITNTLVNDGRLSAQEALMRHAAERSQQALRLNPDAELLNTENLHVYRGWHSLPPTVRLITGNQRPDDTLTMLLNDTEDPRIGALMRYPVDGDKDLYVHLYFDPQLLGSNLGSGRLLWTQLLLNLTTFVLILLIGWFLSAQVLKPIRAMSRQLRYLNWHDLDLGQPPRLRYRELQTVYDALFSSVSQLKQQQQKEAQFLRYASHELRSPIAVMQSSLELEQRRHGELTPPLQRAQDASEEMQAVVDTLLWLGRTDHLNMTAEPIRLDQLVQTTVASHQRIVSPRVSLRCHTSPYTLTAIRPPVQILLNNLLRNSLEHGSGEIQLRQKDNRITLSNGIAANNQQGFGLGLMLVQQLAGQFGWHYHVRSEAGIHHVEVRF
ncbi:sensor histidine kinase [Ferrimonas kyonanensis]|uniref:sensor histidine kinase n=1 Tax=Ferrimonas kyonanensis TaxID=364763 RepID=UPI0004136792|nr:HAMP domain-containing sensor histidine kinase [Ferrimonas kyonanensis]